MKFAEKKRFVEYRSTNDSLLENYSSFLFAKFIGLRNFKGKSNSPAEKSQNLFSFIKINPEDAFSITSHFQAKQAIYDLIQAKGFQKEQYNDIKAYLIALDSAEFLNSENFAAIFEELSKAFFCPNKSGLKAVERRTRASSLTALAEVLGEMKAKLIRHTSVLIRTEKQSLLSNEQVILFIVNRIKFQVSLLKLLKFLHKIVYKIVKGFGLIERQLKNIFRPNKKENIKIILSYFLPVYDYLTYFKSCLGDESELFNVKNTFGKMKDEALLLCEEISEFLAVDKEDLEIAISYFYKIQRDFDRNEVS